MQLDGIVVECKPLGFQERTMRCVAARERNIPVFGDLAARIDLKTVFYTPTIRSGARVRTETRFQSPRSIHGEKKPAGGPRESSESRDSEGPVLRSREHRTSPAAHVRMHLPMYRSRSCESCSRTILGIELITLRSPATSPN